MSAAYLEHLTASSDLRTPYEAVRAGFIALALEKNRRATPFVDQARALRHLASKAKSPSDLLDNAELLPALVAAAGVSDKAAKHLTTMHKREAIRGLLREYLEPAGPDFVEELVFRFLLNRGDTLGGSMRNVGGFMAQCKLTRCLLSHLTLAKHDPLWLNNSNGNVFD